MSLPTNRFAFLDCYDIFDKAIETANGVRVPVKDHDSALHLRMRLHQARKINRQDNLAQYEPGHPMYGCSAYDPLVIRIKNINERFYIYLEPNSIDLSIIEELEEPKLIAAPEPMRMIEAPRVEPISEPTVIEPIRRRI